MCILKNINEYSITGTLEFIHYNRCSDYPDRVQGSLALIYCTIVVFFLPLQYLGECIAVGNKGPTMQRHLQANTHPLLKSY